MVKKKSMLGQASIKYVVFDFDGTLANTFNSIKEIAKGAFGNISDSDIELMRNEGVKAIIKQHNIPMWRLPFLMGNFLYELQKKEDIELYPNVAKMLNGVKQLYSMGVLSSNSKEMIANVLRTHNVLDKFDFIFAKSSLFGKDRTLRKMCQKYCLNPNNVLYVGDEDRDIVACKKVGVKVLAVSYGFNSRKRLEELNPDGIADTPMEIVDYLT